MPIPDRLNMIWIGPRPFPHQRYLDAWIELHPGWETTLWTEGSLPELQSQPVIDQIDHQAGKANLIRLELLLRFGGVYVDADTEPRKPLDTLPIPEGTDSWAMTSRHDLVQNAIMASVPDHPVLRRLVDLAPIALRRLQGTEVFFTQVFGAHYITKPLRAHPHFWEPDRGRRWPDRQVFRDREEGEPGDAWVIHDCDRSWKAELGGTSRVQL